ncbi:MAG: SigB/SigF/SigG family RNA polymerase sigma factor [Christensenellales bacterium]|jgi:RNA polymerase sporulation-specific sigma factor
MSALLSHEETIALLRKAQDGDDEAQETLVKHNAGLVRSLSMRFINRGIDYEEIYQIGCIGLIKAIRNYDEQYNVRFSTYAVPLITGEIKRFLRDDGMIKISRITKETSRKIMGAAEELRTALNREPSIQEICEKTGLCAEDIVYAMEATQPVVSLFEPVYDEGGSKVLLMDHVPDVSDEPDLDSLILLKQMIVALPPRERQLIIMRYFKDMTQTQIAKRMGISQVQVSRLENKILKKLREQALP